MARRGDSPTWTWWSVASVSKTWPVMAALVFERGCVRHYWRFLCIQTCFTSSKRPTVSRGDWNKGHLPGH
jgi:hypothetical protein